jgi:hypothetical protein
MNGIEVTVLRLAGVPQSTIDEVEKAIPSTAALLNLIKQNQNLINKILAVVAEAQPLLVQALPLVNQAVVEINSVLPAAQDVLAFLQTKQTSDTTVIADNQQGSGPT